MGKDHAGLLIAKPRAPHGPAGGDGLADHSAAVAGGLDLELSLGAIEGLVAVRVGMDKDLHGCRQKAVVRLMVHMGSEVTHIFPFRGRGSRSAWKLKAE